MQIIPIYKYIRSDGGVSVSPNKPDCEYTEMFRIIADEGCTLRKGDLEATCVDAEEVEEWEELLPPEKALEVIIGGETV